MKALARVLVASVLAFAAVPASATVQVYTSPSDFLSALNVIDVDDFADVAGGSWSPPLVRATTNFGYSLDVINAQGGDTLFFGADADGKYASTFQSDSAFFFDKFSGDVSAIGGSFFGVGQQDDLIPDTALILTAGDADGQAEYRLSTANAKEFLGFTSDKPLTFFSVRLATLGNGAFPGLSNLILGTTATTAPAVPEPATWAMMLVGFGSIGFAMRRRRTNKPVVTFA
jgi:hypothetical protein